MIHGREIVKGWIFIEVLKPTCFRKATGDCDCVSTPGGKKRYSCSIKYVALLIHENYICNHVYKIYWKANLISLIFFSDLMHLQKLIRNECFGYTFVLFSFYIVIPSTFNMLGLFVHTHAPSSCRSYNPLHETNPNKYTKNTAHRYRKRRKFKKIILILDQNRSKLQDRRSEGEEENGKKKFEIPSKKRHQDRTSSSLLPREEGEEEKWRTAGIRIF